MLRTCTSCGLTDDHPRDVINVLPGEEPRNYHFDCHAAMGCVTCTHQLKGAPGAQGGELRNHLTSLDPLTPEQVANLYAKDADHG